MHEALLLRLSDEDFAKYRAPLAGSGTTGDSVVDEWEAELERGGLEGLKAAMEGTE